MVGNDSRDAATVNESNNDKRYVGATWGRVVQMPERDPVPGRSTSERGTRFEILEFFHSHLIVK